MMDKVNKAIEALEGIVEKVYVKPHTRRGKPVKGYYDRRPEAELDPDTVASPPLGIVRDTPTPGSEAERHGLKKGDQVSFSFHSVNQYFRGSGKVVGFQWTDVVIEEKGRTDRGLYVDAKNVFSPHPHRKHSRLGSWG